MLSPYAVVCGLAAEARIARAFIGDDPIIVGGGDCARLEATLDALPNYIRFLVSFGVAGGLESSLRPGDIRVANAVVDGSRRLEADRAWAAKLAAALDAPCATFAGTNTVVAQIEDKTKLRAATGASCVDMETHIVARVASRRGCHWAAVRTITDPADRALPHAAVVGMRPDGSIDLPAILRSLIRDPGQLPGLIRTGRDARAAFAALLRCRQALVPGFGLAGLDLR